MSDSVPCGCNFEARSRYPSNQMIKRQADEPPIESEVDGEVHREASKKRLCKQELEMSPEFRDFRRSASRTIATTTSRLVGSMSIWTWREEQRKATPAQEQPLESVTGSFYRHAAHVQARLSGVKPSPRS